MKFKYQPYYQGKPYGKPLTLAQRQRMSLYLLNMEYKLV
jgi:hypothetical protein